MNYKKIILLTSLLLSIMTEVVPAAKEDEFVPPEEIGKPREDTGITLDDVVGTGGFSFTPRAIAGSMYYRYQEIYTKDKVDLEDYIPFLGAGITLGYKNFFLDFYARRSASGKDNLFNKTFDTDIVKEKENNAILLRKDYGINLNYQLSKKIFVENENIVFSVGYKVGRSDISGTNRNVISGSYTRSNYEKRFETSGPTVGIAYGYPIGDSSILGINLAYAWLDTEYTLSEGNRTFNTEKATGLTYGIKWSGAITNELTYGLSVDYYQYTLGNSITDERITIQSIEESVVTAKASISYAFDLF